MAVVARQASGGVSLLVILSKPAVAQSGVEGIWASRARRRVCGDAIIARSAHFPAKVIHHRQAAALTRSHPAVNFSATDDCQGFLL